MHTLKRRFLGGYLFSGKWFIYIPVEFSILKAIQIKFQTMLSFLLTTAIQIRVVKGSLKETRRVTQVHKDMLGLVIGNGPTAANLDLDRVRLEREASQLLVFLVNFSLLDPEIRKCGCDYLVLSDPATHPSVYSVKNQELWTAVLAIENIKVVTPTSWHGKLPNSLCKKGQCLHFVDTSLEGLSKNISPVRPRGYSTSTAYKAIAYAIHLGISKTYIIGIDNSNFRTIQVDDENRLIQTEHHFKDGYAEPIDLTSFFPKGIGAYFYELSILFLTLKRCFSNSNIVNLGVSSEVDAFPKIKPGDFGYDLLKVKPDNY
jgi:hypothetical protein